ncbi:hypothetical protein [Sphingomonas sp. KC8]|uniref:hypothetical protein n=1 Tax=Sphingomonas sp. KC8 TaxID=1030157 RepID=UPI0002488B5B|nr:hypothetical protein [Sphingomonas sp. KC8]ARS26508.1 hypothetical protein KC8_04275 [Sphingomonas sp. KC8]
MPDDRITTAIDRIEQALIRIENRGAANRAGGNPAVEALGQLQARYDKLADRERRLRERTSSALDRLNTLIERRKAR